MTDPSGCNSIPSTCCGVGSEGKTNPSPSHRESRSVGAAYPSHAISVSKDSTAILDDFKAPS